MRTIWKIGIGVFLLGGVVSALKPQPKELTAEEKAIRERRLREFTAVTDTKALIQKQMRDPSSAVFEKVDGYTDRKYKGQAVTVVCGAVNGKNGFGGYTGMRRFVRISELDILVFKADDYDKKFSALWNSLCAGEHS